MNEPKKQPEDLVEFAEFYGSTTNVVAELARHIVALTKRVEQLEEERVEPEDDAGVGEPYRPLVDETERIRPHAEQLLKTLVPTYVGGLHAGARIDLTNAVFAAMRFVDRDARAYERGAPAESTDPAVKLVEREVVGSLARQLRKRLVDEVFAAEPADPDALEPVLLEALRSAFRVGGMAADDVRRGG